MWEVFIQLTKTKDNSLWIHITGANPLMGKCFTAVWNNINQDFSFWFLLSPPCWYHFLRWVGENTAGRVITAKHVTKFTSLKRWRHAHRYDQYENTRRDPNEKKYFGKEANQDQPVFSVTNNDLTFLCRSLYVFGLFDVKVSLIREDHGD